MPAKRAKETDGSADGFQRPSGGAAGVVCLGRMDRDVGFNDGRHFAGGRVAAKCEGEDDAFHLFFSFFQKFAPVWING